MEMETETESNLFDVIIKILKITVKIGVAVILYCCWAGKFPEHFQQMLLVSFIGFVWISYKELRADNFITMIFSLMGAALLNPFYPLYFNASVQYWAYLILAIGFAISAIFDLVKPPQNHETE